MKKIFLFIFILLLIPAQSFPDAGFIILAPGGNVIPVENDQVSMRDEQINIELLKERFIVNVDYTFQNSGESQTVIMGFPNSRTKDMEGKDLYGISDFKAFDGERELKVFRKEKKEQKSKYITDLYECFEVDFKKNETKNIKNTYSQVYARGNSDDQIKAEYILKTGASWKGKIGSVKVNIMSKIPAHEWVNKTAYFADGEEIFDFDFNIKIRPEKYRQNKNVYIMEFSDIEPDFNIEIIRPPLFIKDATASSELGSKDGKYKAENLLDGDPSTAWVEGKKDWGMSEYVDFDTNPFLDNNAGSYKVKKIGIINGYAKNKDVFKMNNRVKQIKLDSESYISNEKLNRTYILKDTMDMQYIEFDKPVLMSRFKITIIDIYKGTKWNDTCLSEVRIVPAEE